MTRSERQVGTDRTGLVNEDSVVVSLNDMGATEGFEQERGVI